MSRTKGRRLGLISNGEIEICLLTNEDLEEALEVLNISFFVKENLCIATDCHLPESIEAREELKELVRSIANDGTSLIARDISTSKIAGVAINKLHEKTFTSSAQAEFLGNFTNSKCKTENVKVIVEILTLIENQFDIFKNWNVDCIMEHFMLATLPEFGRRNIGYSLCMYSVQLALELGQGIGNFSLPQNLQHCRPKVIYAIFTSNFSQKIGERLGFEVLETVPFSEFSFNGIRFSEKLDPMHDSFKLAARKL